ncbi:hypothetical protein [Rhizobium sp. BK491]|uniref:hypothetical protein n=1 Tax=Rhizobium sp. BK491 TaxID=2587009 RepID=UPI000DD5EFB6|nr:hypothetical protein [Rhizobium sp. BK491]MBB3571573.1 hypothetical protein [Rhizobium sp. BK491]
MTSEKQTDLVSTLWGIGEAFNQFWKAADAWLKKPEVQGAFKRLFELPTAIDRRIKTQRMLLRRGILPSDPVLALHTEQAALTAALVARDYAAKLDSKGHSDDARVFREIASLSELGNATHTLRVIYPEIEAVARRYMYETGVTEGITSLVEMRFAIGDLQNDSLGVAAELLATETFIFVNLFAIDYAYRGSYDASKRGRRAFAKVANRHQVCHGISSDFDEMHVINALTLLYISVVVGQFMVKEGKRLAKENQKFIQTLSQQRSDIKEINREMLSLILSLRAEGPDPKADV